MTLAVGPPHATELPAEGAKAAVRRFLAWHAGFGPLSHDPYDLWATGAGVAARRVYYRRRRAGAVLALPFVALDVLAPRAGRLPLQRRRYPIADAHYACGLLAWESLSGDAAAGTSAHAHLDALLAARAPGFADLCWGYPIRWETAAGTFEAGRPLITVTPYGYDACEAAFERDGDEIWLERMRSVARFAHEQIPVARVSASSDAAAYTPSDVRRVVNASAYRAFLLARAGTRFGSDVWLDAARRNIAFVLESQAADGSWPYAVDGLDDFVDNFHTCLVLKNLVKSLPFFAPWPALADAIVAGYDFYRERLLDEQGLPVPFARAQRVTLYRRDLYDYAEGVNLAVLLRRAQLHPAAGGVARTLVDSLLEEWQLPDGHFATRKMLRGWNVVPYHRWAQAQTFRALVQFCEGG